MGLGREAPEEAGELREAGAGAYEAATARGQAGMRCSRGCDALTGL